MAVILTQAQLQALKADIAADPALSPLPNNSDGNFAIALAYNAAASPAYTIWRKRVGLSEIAKALDGTELAGLSSLNHTRLQTVITLINAAGGADPSDADARAFFDDIFSGAGGVNTRAALLALWKTPATRAQKLFSTGAGSDASPATTAANVGDGFALSHADVGDARNLP
jgi:hypothetical protein